MDNAQTTRRGGTGGQPVRLLVVGAGNRGTAYAKFALDHPVQARVVAVAEPRDVYRERLATLHGIPPEACFRSWQDVPDGMRVADAAIIATPDRQHLEPTLALARRGYGLLIEKPLATSESDCRAIVEAVESAGVVGAVAHVLRYTAYTRLIKELIENGAIGDLVNFEHLEPVGYWHHAHAYVRGNWRREDESSSFLLAKCCHDFDWLGHLVGRPCLAVASFGKLTHFQPSQRPEGAAERCLDCSLEPTCTYSAPRLYLELARREEAGWPVSVLTSPVTEQSVLEALATGPYGRCVWACDNDVVDHQVVALSYEGGVTGSVTATAFSQARARETRLFGTRGELYGDGNRVTVYDFQTEQTTTLRTGETSDDSIRTGHGGGDMGLMADFVAAVAAGDPHQVDTTPREALSSHRVVFAAEQARREGRVVELAHPPNRY